MSFVGSAPIQLVSSDDLASAFGFAGANDSFRSFCRDLGIRPIRRNPNYYDTKHVRVQLDLAQGLSANLAPGNDEVDLIARRRSRLAAQ